MDTLAYFASMVGFAGMVSSTNLTMYTLDLVLIQENCKSRPLDYFTILINEITNGNIAMMSMVV